MKSLFNRKVMSEEEKKNLIQFLQNWPSDLPMSGLILSSILERFFEWRKWMTEIPFIKWPADWEVKAVPPMAGAIIRYHVKTPKTGDNFFSIYLDCYEELGIFGGPYWEVYPVDGDTARFAMADTKSMIDCMISQDAVRPEISAFDREMMNKAFKEIKDELSRKADDSPKS